MANRWYVALEGEELGPLSDTGLERLIQGEKIDSETLVRNGANGEWMPAYLAEEMLAARPSRQRPGEAAIQAARRSKQAAARPRVPPAKLPPTNSPPAQPSDAPASAAPAAGLRPPALPATNAMPQSAPTAAQSPPVAASDSAEPAPNSDAARGDTTMIQPPAATRSVLVWLGAAAGALVLLAGSFYAGWLLVGSSLSVGNAAAASPIPNVSPQLAALRQEAEQLRREVAEASQKHEGRSSSPAEASQDGPPSAAATSHTSAQDQAAAENDLPAMPPPDANPVVGTANDLAAERKQLAEMVAVERIVSEERERKRRHTEEAKSNPAIEFEPMSESAIDQHFAEAEAEVSQFDTNQLAARRQEVEAARIKRYKEAADLTNSAQSDIERIEIPQAMEKLSLSVLLGPPEEAKRLNKLIESLSHATPHHVEEILKELSDSRLQQLIANRRLPDDWPDRVEDQTAAKALLKCAVQLAPLLYGLRQHELYVQRFKQAEETIDLATKRKMFFLLTADQANEDGQIAAAEAKPIVDVFGTFQLDDLSPLADSVLASRYIEMAADPTRDLVIELAQGKVQMESMRDIYEKCRNAAGDAWPADDRPHPLAGRWKGPASWEIEIDPRHDAIAFSCFSPKATFEQRICKIGPDYLIAYEPRKVPVEHVDTDPFGQEKYSSNDRAPGPGDPLPGEAIAFTYYSQGRGQNALELRRRILPASFVKENGNKTFWEFISLRKEYREFPATYRRIKRQARP